MKKVIIIGAGIAGCNAAKQLSEYGFDVQVLEKSRGAGGRMSTKRMNGTRADHGAQYFSAKTAIFKTQVELWLEKDLGEFNGSFTARNLGQHEHLLLKIGNFEFSKDKVLSLNQMSQF